MFGRKAKLRKAVEHALAGVEGEDDLPDHAPIEALPPELRAEGFGWLAVALHDDERFAAARISLERALALAPDELELHRLAAAIAIALGDRDAAIAAQRRVVGGAPRDVEALVVLAELLIDGERPHEAIAVLEPARGYGDPAIGLRLGEALFVADRTEEALAVLDEVVAYYDAQMKQLSAASWHALKERALEAQHLRDDAYAELHGREATIELAAAGGKLDAGAGVNYRLLGARLAADAARLAEVFELEPPDTTERRGRELLARDPRSASGLVLVGSAQLRRGEVSAARTTFERACEADGRCFAAFLGLGAAIDHENYTLHRLAARLPSPPRDPSSLAAVVPDWPALTDAERRVVWLSAQPLGSMLPALAERGVVIRILPIDVRATDVGLFEHASGERAGDHRSYDAIGGVAQHDGAIAKVEELLDVATSAGLTFAHELAHLAFFHIPQPREDALLAIYERALEVGYASTEYALSNADEFFAVSYVEYLRHRHALPGAPEDDDAGIQRELRAYFDEL